MDEEERFRSAVARSWDAVFAVARHLHAKGDCAIRIEPLRIRPDQNQKNGYGDKHDLYVNHGHGWLGVEVKGRKFPFTCRQDFPFKSIYIDRADKIKAAPASAYVHVDKTLTHAAVIHICTKDHWTGPVTIFDRDKGYENTVMECPTFDARFIELKNG